MEKIYKKPIFYYVLAPLLAAIWPLAIWSVYLPAAKQKLDTDTQHYEKSAKIMEAILLLDPERLSISDSNQSGPNFSYAEVISKVAAFRGISPDNYKISSGMIINSGGQKSQNAALTIKEVDIRSFAEFLSTIQFRWANLQCLKVKLSKKKGLPDSWKVDLDLKYYY